MVDVDGASPSGKAAGFGPAISEVRILPPQPYITKKIPPCVVFFLSEYIIAEDENHKAELCLGSNKPSRGMSNNVAKGEARINQNHAFDFECERFRLTRGAAQAEQRNEQQCCER